MSNPNQNLNHRLEAVPDGRSFLISVPNWIWDGTHWEKLGFSFSRSGAEDGGKGSLRKVANEGENPISGQSGVADAKLIFFGSHAKGNPKEWSDIDLIVISSDFEGKGYWERIDILSKAIAKIWQPIEAVAFTPEEWENGDSIFREFVKEGSEVIE